MKPIYEYLLSSKKKVSKETIIRNFKEIINFNKEDQEAFNEFIDLLCKNVDFEYVNALYEITNELIEENYNVNVRTVAIQSKVKLFTNTKSINFLSFANSCSVTIYNIPEAKAECIVMNEDDIDIYIAKESTARKLIDNFDEHGGDAYDTDGVIHFDPKKNEAEYFSKQIHWILE